MRLIPSFVADCEKSEPVEAWGWEAPGRPTDGDRISIAAANRASIGYRIDGGPWQLYGGPFAATGELIEAKAIGCGWRESPVTRMERQ